MNLTQNIAFSEFELQKLAEVKKVYMRLYKNTDIYLYVSSAITSPSQYASKRGLITVIRRFSSGGLGSNFSEQLSAQ